MIKMQIAIIDDMHEETDFLVTLLKKYQEKYSQNLSISFYESGEEFLQNIQKGKFHMIFMDIYMDKIDGIETAQRLYEIDQECLITFLTTSDEDIWRAVKMHGCFDYIKKEELNYERMEKLLKDAEKKCELLNKTLTFVSGKQEVKIPFRHIQYIVSRDKYCEIYLTNGEKLSYRVNFSTLDNSVKSQNHFLLCNRGILINMDYIEKTDKEIFIMSDGQKFPIRRKDHYAIISRYNEYQFEKLNEQEILE